MEELIQRTTDEIWEVRLQIARLRHTQLVQELARLRQCQARSSTLTVANCQQVKIRGSAGAAVKRQRAANVCAVGQVLQSEPRRMTLGVGSKPYDVLCNEMGRWGGIMGYAAKSKTAKKLKCEIAPHPMSWAQVREHAEPLIGQFLQLRGISSMWQRNPDNDKAQHRALYYKFKPTAETTPQWLGACTQAYAGSYWHAVWVISHGGGRMRESRDKGDGGEFHTPGFFCSPVWGCAGFYAWATHVFNDGLFYGVMYDVAVDTHRITNATQNIKK